MGDYQNPYEQYIYNYAMSGGVSSYNPGEDPQQQQASNTSNKYSNNRDRNNRDNYGNNSGYSNNNRNTQNSYDNRNADNKPSYYNNNNDANKKNYSDNSNFNTGSSDLQVQRETIFVSNLPKTVTVSDLEKHFGSIGLIKVDKKTGQPKVWIYKDKQTGEGKGEATVTYDDEAAASAAIEWFNEKEVMGQIVKVSLATRKSQNTSGGFRGGRGGGNSRGGMGGGRGGGGGGGSNNYGRNDRSNNDRPRGGYSNNDRDRNRGGGGGDRGPDRGNDRYSRPAPY